MKPIQPIPGDGEALVIFAAQQPEYDPLPAVVRRDGVIRTEFELSAEDLSALLNGGRIRLWIWTFKQPLQPIALEVIE